MKFSYLPFVLSIMLSCTSSGADYYREQGSALSRSLLIELKKVHTREELLDRQAKIETLFMKLKALIHESDRYIKAHPDIEVPLFTRQNQDVSDALQAEINRLLRIEGCRELLNEFLTHPTQNALQSGPSSH